MMYIHMYVDLYLVLLMLGMIYMLVPTMNILLYIHIYYFSIPEIAHI